MSETEWTPGPWIVDRQPDGEIQILANYDAELVGQTWRPSYDVVATVSTDNCADDPAQVAACARVLAASPEMFNALEAHQAWSWAEKQGAPLSTFDERMELCRYAEYLTNRAVAKALGKHAESEYSGVPHLIVWPEVGIARADADAARQIVNRILTDYRSALAKARGEQ